MRASEKALHKWMADMGAPLTIPAEQANWQDLLRDAASHLRTVEQRPKTRQRDEDLAYFGESLAHFSAIKNAWRNHVSHTKVTYDERAAKAILDHVRAFMGTLASR